jgi:outer membrane protein
MRALSLFFLGFFISSVHADSIKIGYIDTDQVVNNLPQYQQSIDQISNEFEPKKQELLDLFKHIELLKSNIENSNFKNNDTLVSELSKLAKLEKNFEQETEFWQKMINNKKIELLQKIELLINTAINNFAITEEYDLIFYENVIFVSDEVDITNEVIEKIQSLSL